MEQLALAQISIAPAPAADLGITLPNGFGQQGATELSPLDLQDSSREQKILERDPSPELGNTPFQSYVAGISGDQLPLFGYNLFGSRQFESPRP